MNALQYRQHRTLARPFLSGELVGLAGGKIETNPYRRDVAGRQPRRRSWSESFAIAWAAGWHQGDLERSQIDANDRRRAALASSEGIT